MQFHTRTTVIAHMVVLAIRASSNWRKSLKSVTWLYPCLIGLKCIVLLSNGIRRRERRRHHNRMKLLNRKRPHSSFTELHADFERPLRSLACKHRLDAAIESLGCNQKRLRASLMPSHSAEIIRPQTADGTGVIRLVLHPEVDRALSENQRHELRKSGLDEILIHSEFTLALDVCARILDTQQASLDAFTLSAGHCTLECLYSLETPQQHAFLTDKSRSGVCIDGVRLAQGVRYQLSHGQTITLLNFKPGSMSLSYTVQDLRAPSASRTIAAAVSPLNVSSMELSSLDQHQLAASSHRHGSNALTHPTRSSHQWRSSDHDHDAQRLAITELSMQALQISPHDTRPAASVVKSRLM